MNKTSKTDNERILYETYFPLNEIEIMDINVMDPMKEKKRLFKLYTDSLPDVLKYRLPLQEFIIKEFAAVRTADSQRDGVTKNLMALYLSVSLMNIIVKCQVLMEVCLQ